MPQPVSRPLRVFLCHASQDKQTVRELYRRLAAEKWIDPWLDDEKLLPGMDWDLEINNATRDADAIIICLSKISVSKEGYVNREIRRALDIALEKVEGTIFVIPLRLDDCTPSFEQLKKLHWLDYFTPGSHEKLLRSLRARSISLQIEIPEDDDESIINKSDDLDLHRFVYINPPPNSKVSYPFSMGKYPVTNAQYSRFLNSPDYANPDYWYRVTKFDENCQVAGSWGSQSMDFLEDELKFQNTKKLLPRYWDDGNLGIASPNNPVVGISFFEASAYCAWLFQNWHTLFEKRANPNLQPQVIRLPLDTEWVTAAGGDDPKWRFAWHEPGKYTESTIEVAKYANVATSGIGHTTPVNMYPQGKSPFGVMDMSGNVWEFQANIDGKEDKYDSHKVIRLRGCSWKRNENVLPIWYSVGAYPKDRIYDNHGFRVVIL